MGPKKLSRLISIVILICFSGFSQSSIYAQEWLEEMFKSGGGLKDRSIFDIREKADEYFKYAEQEYYSRYFKLDDYPELQYKNIRQYISYKRWEEYWLNHVDTKGFPVSPLTEFNEFQKFKNSSPKGPIANWSNINRTAGLGGYWGMGRIREIAFHPTEPNTIWLGADQGGIWKSEDNGNTYTPVGDDLPFLRVSSICVDYTNPDILYMAGGGIGTNYWQRAIGVYKTIDGGENWIPTGFTSELADGNYVRRLAMSPVNPSILIVTTREGTYRTDDAGETWNLVYGGEAWDILFHPDGNSVFIGRKQAIMKSVDSGLNWTTAISTSESGIFKHMATSPINNNFLTAQLETDGITSIYVSTDKGISWQNKSIVEDAGGTIGFSSSDENTLYRGWTKIFKSSDLGSTWTQQTNWYATQNYPEVHADHFRIEKNPHKDNTLYFCNDGGLYILDEENSTWTEKSEGLIISQYYSLSSSQSDPSVLLCGSQDNGGWYRRSDGTWTTTNGGDGMHTWQSPDNKYYGYSSYPGGKIYRTYNAWNSYYSLFENMQPAPDKGDWNSRFAIDPNKTDRIVTGCFADVYESMDKGQTWSKISSSLTGGYKLHSIAIPETDSRIIYTSSGPYFYYTYNGGQDWDFSYVGNGNTIQDIAVSDYDPKLVWVVTGGFSMGSKVFESENGGRSWKNISGSLPNIAALSIIHRKGTTENLYVGMSYGVYYRTGSMDDWEFFGHGIPNTEIRDLDIQYNEQKIRCATYGRGLYEADLHPLDGVIPVADYSVNKNILCEQESVVFTNNSSDAESFIWDFGDGNSSTIENPEHSYTMPGNYKVKLIAFNGDYTASYTSYSSITVEPNINPVVIGPRERYIGPGRFSEGNTAGLIFNVHTPSRLLSIMIYSVVRARRSFEIIDANGELIHSTTQNIKPGKNTIELNTELPPGKDYIIRINDNTGLYYNYEGASYPYGIDNHVSITGNTVFDRNGYFYFYNMQFQYIGCDPEMLPIIEEGDNIPVEEIVVYPNPARDIISIKAYGFEPDENISVRILNTSGKTLYNREIGIVREFDIDLSPITQQSGNLLLEISGQRTTKTRQILRIAE